MSIIYEALKKVEDKKVSPRLEKVDSAFSIRKKEEKVIAGKKRFFLPLIVFLIALGLVSLPFILTNQERSQKALAPVAEKREVDPARIYRIPESMSQAPGEVILREGPVQEYILEGIVYDEEASFAIISGKVIKETDTLGSFRIDKISKDKVEMTNTGDNNKVTLSLPD